MTNINTTETTLKYEVGTRLKARHKDPKGNQITARITKADPYDKAFTYLIKTSDGTIKWLSESQLTTTFKRIDSEGAATPMSQVGATEV